MINASFAKFAASSLVLGTALIGGGPIGEQFSVASAQSSTSQVTAAATAAKNARKALAKGHVEKAVAYAERAVGLAPNDAANRMLLGEAYLAAGRFVSAGTSYTDVLSLSPANNRAALRLALTQIALGKVDEARAIIDDNKQNFAAADYGLALALTGDHQGAISALEDAVRSPGNDARTRQNLALAYALDGRWVQARSLAAQDVSPDLLDSRMTQWAALSRPKASWDQVAGVLGVSPVEDAGQPVQLALNTATNGPRFAAAAAPKPVSVAVALPANNQDAAPLFEMGAAGAERAAPVAASQSGDEAVEMAQAQTPIIEFAPRREIVQPIGQTEPQRTARAFATSRQVPLVRAQATPIKTAAVSPKAHPSSIRSVQRQMIVETVKPRSNASPSKESAKAGPAKAVQTVVAAKTAKRVEAGQFVVQLGAYANRAAVESAWAGASGKAGGHSAVTSQVTTNGKTFQRLALSGFGSAADAQAACSKIKSSGGQCFVKSAANDGTRWASLSTSKAVRIASR